MAIDSDLKNGKTAEDFVQHILETSGITCEAVKRGQRSFYDFKCSLDNLDFTIEVKFDMMAAKTKNLAVEFHNPRDNKASGIGITKATFWVYCLTSPKSVWMIKTDKLKKYIETHDPKRIIEAGGDGNASLYLYRLEDILKEFVRIDNVNQDKLLEVINECLDGSSEEQRKTTAKLAP